MNIFQVRAGIALSVLQLATGWRVEESGFLYSAGARDFSLLHSVQIDFVAHPAS
jgi:hypothetical protein